jgi:hypothetical protein
MAVVKKPFSARLRLIDASEKAVQTLGRINPNLRYDEAMVVRNALNTVRRTNAAITGGFFTVTEELTEE